MLDFDGDGDQDVFQYGEQPKLWQRNTTGKYFDITAQSDVSFPMHPTLALAEDFTGDGYPDILVVYFESSPIFMVGYGAGTFLNCTVESGLSGITCYWEVENLDLENGGDQDLIFQSYGQETILENDGSGHFTDITEGLGLNNPHQTEDITCGDLNNDGYSDVVLTNWRAPPAVFINDRSGRFAPMDGPWDFEYASTALIVDFNRDNLQDILFTRPPLQGESLLYRNLGNQRYELVSSDVADLPRAFHADAADIDDNGWPDLILEGTDWFAILINENGSFTDCTEILVGMSENMAHGWLHTSPKAQFIDIDGDGDIDIYSQMVVFENQGLDPSGPIFGVRQPPSPRLALAQNYPNPFNLATTIRYILPQKAFVRLVVYNLLGQEVRTLVEGIQSVGAHSVRWDGTNEAGKQLPSGVYLYQLQTPAATQMQKMLLLR